MAQGDYLIQNQSFPSFRSDLNSTLEAINTSNSGTSRPSSAVAGTVWLDTTNATNPTLKLYDGTDDISLAIFDYSANTVNWLDSTVSADLVNDLSPQLGGMLDVNGNAIGNGTEELIKFSETASAVNEVTVTNSATGNAPEISATGSDTNIDFKLTPKGTGKLILDGLNFPTADGTADQVLKTDGSGNLSFTDVSGGTNTPYIEVVLSTVAVTLTSGIATKIPFNVIKHNVGGGTWDGTNYRYTPGVAGRYMLAVTASISADSNNAQMGTLITVKKNGTIEHYPSGTNNRDEGQGRGHLGGGVCMIDLDTDDYVEAFATNTSESSANGRIDGESSQTFMSIFKLAE